MVLVFIFLGILILLFIQFTVIVLSNIRVEIRNLKIENKNYKEDSMIKGKYKIKLSINFLDRIPIMWTNLDNEKIAKIKDNPKIKNLKFDKLTDKFKEEKVDKKEILHIIKKIKIESIKIIASIGTEDVILTSYTVAVISSIIGVIIAQLADKNTNSCKYLIQPIYENKNEYHIALNGIFCIKIVHIICNILKLLRKGSNKKDERTSNRRSYAYRYE